MTTPLEDIEFLARSEHRVDALSALTEQPCDRDDLQKVTGASKATIGRLLNEFERRAWVARTGHQYELTRLGEFIADGFTDLVERMETGQSIRDVWQWFSAELGFTIEMFSGAEVTFPDANNPYCPNTRYVELAETSTSLREFGTVPLKPENVEMVFKNAVAGMDVELVYPVEVMEYMLRMNPRLTNEALESGHLTVFTHDDLPGGLGIFDDRVATCCRDYETGISRAIIDTDAEEALEHAVSLYETYRREASPIDSETVVAR